MAEATAPSDAAAGPPDPGRLEAAVREARNDAAPFALLAAGILVVMALVSKHAHWDLLGHPLWWIWLVVAVPYVDLSATLLFGLGRLVRHDRRREIVIARLALVWVFNVLGVVVLVVSLVAHSGVQMTGRQLLSAAAQCGSPTPSRSGLLSGNSTVEVRLPVHSRLRPASPTSSSRKTRTPS
jgi:hypothetical protein